MKKAHRSAPAGTVLAVALLAMGLAQSGCVSAPPPTGAAEWIWADGGGAEPGVPASYVLLRDFELPAAPEAAARLFVVADREYAVHLNGHQMARGAYRRGEPIDEFQVAHLLREGSNRLTIEARAPHGDGGVLAGVELDDGSMPVVTDGEWRFTEAWDPRLVKGEIALADAAPTLRPVRVWGRPPVGRWGRVSRGELRKPDQIWRSAVAWRIVRVTASPGLEIEPGMRSSHRVDFGREVAGVLELDFRPSTTKGHRELRICLAGDCERRSLVLTPGRPAWRDADPRSFDTVIVSGVPGLRAVRARR
ncbi:MAG: hypothetical protein F4112_11010 [Holophagales bacterium]|nr:hypothetical protein [Holophagales bacterium]MYD23962.1 hypothetical protein [Holophagales bacterium]MYI33485.1 hypothetical protein [Holophagales bacterium]